MQAQHLLRAKLSKGWARAPTQCYATPAAAQRHLLHKHEQTCIFRAARRDASQQISSEAEIARMHADAVTDQALRNDDSGLASGAPNQAELKRRSLM